MENLFQDLIALVARRQWKSSRIDNIVFISVVSSGCRRSSTSGAADWSFSRNGDADSPAHADVDHAADDADLSP
jgi:hypothetical protein